MNPMLNMAVRAARRAGDKILRFMDRVETLTITEKQRNDFVSEVDRAAEDEIVQVLKKAYPSHAILAEESGASGNNEYEWVIDPLDGTTNFLHGFPQFSVSIGLRRNGKMEEAVVYDPLRDELFTASKGQGARLNDRKLRVTNCKDLSGTLIGTGFPYRAQQRMDTYLAMFKDISTDCADQRRAGSAALDLAYVAAGRLDGFWEMGLQPWDMAAGVLLIREAGGMVGDFQGGEDFMEIGDLVAGSPKVFRELLIKIRAHS